MSGFSAAAKCFPSRAKSSEEFAFKRLLGIYWVDMKPDIDFREKLELERIQVFKQAVFVLKEEFQGTAVSVILVGSLVQPYRFKNSSDVDIVLQNYQGDCLDLKQKLEAKLGRDVEVYLYENSTMQDYINQVGIKVYPHS